jgi:hypothetical protein
VENTSGWPGSGRITCPYWVGRSQHGAALAHHPHQFSRDDGIQARHTGGCCSSRIAPCGRTPKWTLCSKTSPTSTVDNARVPFRSSPYRAPTGLCSRSERARYRLILPTHRLAQDIASRLGPRARARLPGTGREGRGFRVPRGPAPRPPGSLVQIEGTVEKHTITAERQPLVV